MTEHHLKPHYSFQQCKANWTKARLGLFRSRISKGQEDNVAKVSMKQTGSYGLIGSRLHRQSRSKGNLGK